MNATFLEWNVPRNIELTVRSLLFASSSQSWVNSTSACLPWLITSILKVVISKFSLSLIRAVIVPCFSPVRFIILIFSEVKISFICWGVAVVAKSKSFGFIFINKSLNEIVTNWLNENVCYTMKFITRYLTAPPAIRISKSCFLKIPSSCFSSSVKIDLNISVSNFIVKR